MKSFDADMHDINLTLRQDARYVEKRRDVCSMHTEINAMSSDAQALTSDSTYVSSNLLQQCKPLLPKRNETIIKLFQYLWLVMQFALWKLTFLHQPAYVEISVGVIIWTQLPYISSKFQTLHTAYHLYMWHSAAFFCLMLGCIRHRDILILLNMASICIFVDVLLTAHRTKKLRTVCACCIAISMHTCLFLAGVWFGTWPPQRPQAWYACCIVALCTDALLYVSCMPVAGSGTSSASTPSNHDASTK